MTRQSQKLSVIEKIGYSLGDLAANLVFQTLVTYLAYFYTVIYGLKNTDASAITFSVGLIAAFAFNPIIGALADRTNTRWGKFRPWILWTAIPLGIVALLAFSTPHFEYKGKVIYAVVTYSLLLLFYAANNLPYGALSGVITGDMKERNSLSSYRFIAVMFAQFFVQVFMLPIIMSAGNGDKAVGIEKVMTWLAIIGTVMLVITFLTTRERVIPDKNQQASIKDDIKDLVKSRPWIIMLILTILVFITLAMKGGSYVFYFNEYVDTPSLEAFLKPVLNLEFMQHLFLPETARQQVAEMKNNGVTDVIASLSLSDKQDYVRSIGFGLFNAGGIIMGLVGIALSSRLANLYGKRDVFRTALFVSTLFILAFALFPTKNVGMMFLSQVLHGFFYGITTPVLWAMIADVADYSEWKNNRRATAITFSAMLMGLKIGLSIGGALVTLLLGYYGYINQERYLELHQMTKETFSQVKVVIQQPESVGTGAKWLISVFPAIPFLLGAGLLFFYEINKKMEVRIETDLKERRK